MIVVELNGRRIQIDGPEADRLIRLAQAKLAAEEAASLAEALRWDEILFPAEEALAEALRQRGLGVMFVHEIRLLARKGEEAFSVIARRDEDVRVTPGDVFKPGLASSRAGRGRAGSASRRAWGWKTDAPSDVVRQVHTGQWRGTAIALRKKAVRDKLVAMGYSVWQE